MHQKLSFNITQKLYLFSFVGIVGNTFFNFYYTVFLYKNLLDIGAIATETLIVAFAGWLGFLLGSYLITKKGYVKTAKLSFLAYFILAIILTFTTSYISSVYLLVAFLRGFPGGVLVSVTQSYLLKEIHGLRRSKYYYLNRSIILLTNVILPFLIGLLIIITAGYQYTFFLSGLVYLFGVLIPLDHNKKPRSRITLPEIKSILKKPFFNQYVANRLTLAAADSLNALMYVLVPYIILGSEFSVGVLTSLTSLLAVLLAVMFRKSKEKAQEHFGIIGGGVRIIANSLLAIIWTKSVLAIRYAVMEPASIFTDPATQNIDTQTQEEILGQSLNESTQEFNAIKETINFIGTALAFIPFIIILRSNLEYQVNVIRIFLVVYAIFKLIHFLWLVWLNHRVKMA